MTIDDEISKAERKLEALKKKREHREQMRQVHRRVTDSLGALGDALNRMNKPRIATLPDGRKIRIG